MSLFRLYLLTLLGLTLAVPSLAQTLPLPLETMPNKAFSDVQAQAKAESTGGPVWGNAPDPSTLPVHQTFTGTVTADSTMTKLAIFSDDGSDVYVDGTLQWSSKDKPQALPDLASSLHELPVTLSAGTHTVEIDYSNIIYTVANAAAGIAPDIDGCTLYEYGPSTVPVVTVTIGDLGDVSVGVPATATATASASPLPGGYSASQLVATWSYSTAYLDYSVDDMDDDWDDATDGSTAAVTLNSAATDPAGTFSGTFNTEGYYEACIQATVSFHNPTTGENFGPYTGYGYVDSDGSSTSNAANPSSTSLASTNSMPHGVPAAPMPAGPSNPKVYAKGPAPTLSITGLSDNAKVSPGGLVVLNVASEGNSAPPQKIVLGVTHGKVGQSLTVTFSVAQNGSGVVRVYDPDAKINLTFNGTDNVFAVKPEAPKTLYVLGLGSGSVGTGITGYSSSMGDVVLTAKAGSHTDKANMTVLWVDTPNFARKDALPSTGKPIDSDNRIGWDEVIAAKVNPAAFSYPNELGYYDNTQHPDPQEDADTLLHMTRDLSNIDWIKQVGVYSELDSTSWTTTPYGHGNDTGPYQYRHDFPSANGGKIDDEDAAGLDISAADSSRLPNTIERTRDNFRAWAVITLPTQQSSPIRCSPIMGYFNRFSMQNGSGGNSTTNNNWHLINPPDIPSDLQLNLGTTSTSADLH